MTDRHVLVIDDDPFMHRVLEREFAKFDISVVVAPSGQDALDHLASGATPDLVLLDIRMPLMDGHEVLTHIRDNPTTALTPIITLSGSTLDDDRTRAWAKGIVGYFRKPDDLTGFRRMVAFIDGYLQLNEPPNRSLVASG